MYREHIIIFIGLDITYCYYTFHTYCVLMYRYRLATCNFCITNGENFEQIIYLKTQHEVTQKNKIRIRLNKYILHKKDLWVRRCE